MNDQYLVDVYTIEGLMSFKKKISLNISLIFIEFCIDTEYIPLRFDESLFMLNQVHHIFFRETDKPIL